MVRAVNKIEANGIVIRKDHAYNIENLSKSQEKHKKLVKEGKITGEFDDIKWMCYPGTDKTGIDFSMDQNKYKSHIGSLFGISIDEMGKMLRCYTISLFNIYILTTLAQNKINIIKEFIQKYRDKEFELTVVEKSTIEDFLLFISTPRAQIQEILNTIPTRDDKPKKSRNLSHIINYLVVDYEISRVFDGECSDEEFLKWFPVYFWTKITFILPMRVTEILLTPVDCICKIDGKTHIKVRRTRLKKNKRVVAHEVEKDYKEFLYEIPDNKVVENIKKYIRLTKSQKRRFLFAYNVQMVNEMVSRRALNERIASFMEEYINNNKRYEFVKYALRMDRFEKINAGDSRHIALQNLRYQGISEDTCRQLANQDSIDICAGYYTNTSETIWASSIIGYLRKIDAGQTEKEKAYRIGEFLAIDMDESRCLSSKRHMHKENLDDCIVQDHLEDCMGCTYYRPSKRELNEFMCIQQQRVDEVSEKSKAFINKLLKAKKVDKTIDEIVLGVLTEAERYRMGCNIQVKEKFEEWRRLKNSRKASF